MPQFSAPLRLEEIMLPDENVVNAYPTKETEDCGLGDKTG